MKILFINHNADLYGASRSLLRMCTRLVKEGHRVEVVLPDSGPLIDALERVGATCRQMPALAIIDRQSMRSWHGRIRLLCRLVVSPWALARLIRRFDADLVHTNVSVIVSSGLAARIARRPHVLHIREFYDEFASLWKIYRRYLMTTSDRILCVSNAVAHQFPASQRIKILHNGFPAEEFKTPSPERIAAFRNHLGVTPEVRLIGLPGRIKLKRKGQETFVEAAALFADQFPDVRFAIIGAPFAGNEDHLGYLVEMTRRLRINDRVLFAGEWPDMLAAYANLDIVVLASGQPEPFGGVVIEAMAMGKPVIGTAIGGTPEQITDGKTGCLVPANDASAMAVALKNLLSNHAARKSMGEAARAEYERKFDFDRFYAELIQHYQSVLGRV